MTMANNRIPRATGMTMAVMAALGGISLAIPAGIQAQEMAEIMVTARRKEESLKDVPLAITAFGADTIEAAGISSLSDVASLTPGLSFFNAFGENLPVPVIRGVVPQDIFGVNATAIFVDGVYISGREGLNFNQLDVERIEVLKGPQSAMYGRNAFAGAINYITKAPDDTFSSKSDAEIGNRGKQRIMGQVSGPLLGETLTGRISAMYDEWDGSYDNTLAPENDIGGYRYRSLQGRLRWRPAESIEVNLGIYSSNDEIDESAVAGLPTNCEDQIEVRTEDQTQGPFPRLQNWCGKIPDLASLPDRLDPAQFPNMVLLPNSVTKDSMPKLAEAVGENRDLTRANLDIRWDLDFGSFNFLTGFSDTEQSSVSDFSRSSGDSLPLIYCTAGNNITAPPTCNDEYARAPMGWKNVELGDTNEEWSQEFRFTSPQDQKLRFLAGAYYFHVESESFPGAPIATTPLPVVYSSVGVGPMALPTLAVGSYIFGQSMASVQPDGFVASFTPDGYDPLGRRTGTETTESWSLFGAMELEVTDKWTAGIEARYSQESIESIAEQYKRCAQPRDLDPVDPLYSYTQYETHLFPFNKPPVPDCMDDYFDLTRLAPCVPKLRNISVGPDDPRYWPYNDGRCDPGVISASSRFDSKTGRLSLKYTFDSGWMAYGAIARGDKPGGQRILNPEIRTGPQLLFREREINIDDFDREIITTYELGIKGYASDNRVYLDLALFYNDWEDIVLRQLLNTSPASGQPFVQPTGFNVNSGDAEVWGWEMTTDIKLTDNLTGRLTAAWTDSQLQNARMDTFALFPSFYTAEPSCAPTAVQTLVDPDPGTSRNEAQDAKNDACLLLSGDVSGNTQMRQPEWTASASLSYGRPLTGEWDWFARTDANYQGKLYVGNDNQSWLPSRTSVNLRLGVHSPRYSVELWARNLLANNNPIAAFRDIYWTNDADIQGLENPATVGAASNFDDFPPLRMSITYPSLRTYGLVGKVRFGGAEN